MLVSVLGPMEFGAVAAELPATEHATDAPTVLVVGDSVSHASTGDWSWRWFTWRHLQRVGASVDFVGPRRDPHAIAPWSATYADPDFDQDHAATWGDSFVDPLHDRHALMATYRPDVVVLELGANDIGWFRQGVADSLARARAWITSAQATSPDTDFVLVEIPWPGHPKAVEYNALLPGLADELSTPDSRLVVAATDPDYALGRAGDESSEGTGATFDHIHPNSQGQQMIGAAVADGLSLLGVGTPYPRPLAVVPQGPPGTPGLAVTSEAGAALVSWTNPPGIGSMDLWTRTAPTPGVPESPVTAWRRLARAVPFPAHEWHLPGLSDCTRQEFRVRGRKRWTLTDESFASPIVGVMVGGPVDPVAPLVDVRAVWDREVWASWTPRSGACSYRVTWRLLSPMGKPMVYSETTHGTQARTRLGWNGSVVSAEVEALDARGLAGSTGSRWQVLTVPVGRARGLRLRGTRLSWKVVTPHRGVHWQVRRRGVWRRVHVVNRPATSVRVRRLEGATALRVRLVDGAQVGSWSRPLRLRPREPRPLIT